MTLAFVHEAHPARVVFGAGVRTRAADEVRRMSIARALVVALPTQVDEWRARLGDRVAAVIDDAVMHVPVDIAARACARAAAVRADGLVAVGGGSTIGLAKAIARQTGLPILAVPTTYAGSEMTSIWGLTEDGKKTTGRDDRVRPRTVLYDPELVMTLPQAVAAASGLNGIAHAMEALYAREVDPVTQLFAGESIQNLAAHLPRPGREPAIHDVTCALYGAWLAGVCLDRSKMGLHHKLCHVLGGSFGLSHAETHAVVLPYVAAFNREAAPAAMDRLARALGATDAPAGLFALARTLGVPPSLAALGFKDADVDEATARVLESPYDNPRPVDGANLAALLRAALAGAPPA